LAVRLALADPDQRNKQNCTTKKAIRLGGFFYSQLDGAQLFGLSTIDTELMQ